MKLKDNIDPIGFLNTVQICEGEVCFVTEEGDRINLKSALPKYLFAVIAANSCLLESGRIECEKNDAARLKQFER